MTENCAKVFKLTKRKSKISEINQLVYEYSRIRVETKGNQRLVCEIALLNREANVII